MISDVNCLLFAVGRDANMVDLGIDVTGVQLDRRGFIEVDEYQNSSVKGVYALGDVAGKKLLTPGENARGWNLIFQYWIANISTNSIAIPKILHAI